MASEEWTIDISREFEGDVVGPIDMDQAAHRILAYCTTTQSGWGVYDLMGVHARRSGRFQVVDASTLLLANAINGQVSLANLAAFNHERRRKFASLVARVPETAELARMDDQGLVTVVDACAFGFPGVWGPKITKVGALFRPGAIPMLDGYVGLAFGFGDEAFSAAARQQGMDRRERIEAVVRAMAAWLATHRHVLVALRGLTEPTVPELSLIPDLRLIDLVLWTSQDDRMPRRARQGPPWSEKVIGARIPLGEFEPVSVSLGLSSR